ncbi:hypothetical protein VPH35_104564 [Triticum aestivum]
MALSTARGSSPQRRRGSGPASYTPPSNMSLRPSFAEPAAAPPSWSCPCSSIDVPAVIHCTSNILSPSELGSSRHTLRPASYNDKKGAVGASFCNRWSELS